MGRFFAKIRENKIVLICFILIITIVLVTEGLVVFYLKYEIKNTKVSNEMAVMEEPLQVEEEITKVVVEIKGEVVTPGIYEVNLETRVMDAITLAGGLTENADIRVNNLSKKVMDEMVIIIYSKDQITNFLTVKEQEQLLNEQCEKDSLTENNACLEVENNMENTTVSINTATKEELMLLPGIGEAKADAIINYRNEFGLFEVIEDIKKVSGIGDSIYDQIKNLITT